MSTIQKNITLLQDEITEACKKAGRNPAEIQILAVTKGRTPEEIQQVIEAGISKIGENRIQMAEEKFPFINLPCEKHFVGHLQSNKINKALALFDVIHAVDTVELAEKINAAAKELFRVIPVFIEVNTSEEPQKFGFLLEDLDQAFQDIHFMTNLHVLGFMTVAKQSDDPHGVRHCFNMLNDMREFIQNKHFLTEPLKLSMGMSEDFHMAIEEGADILRIGKRLFE